MVKAMVMLYSTLFQELFKVQVWISTICKTLLLLIPMYFNLGWTLLIVDWMLLAIVTLLQLFNQKLVLTGLLVNSRKTTIKCNGILNLANLKW